MAAVDLGSGAFWWLIAIGALAGAFSMMAFQKWSDAKRMRSAVNAIAAHLMEFRLFADEPRVILRAQRDLLSANARFLGILMGPLLLLAAPFMLVLTIADAFFARAPLRLGEAAVVTAQCRPDLVDIELHTPSGIVLETPAVRVREQNQISWRIRANHTSSGALRLLWNSRSVEKSITAEPGLRWISQQRSGSFLNFLAHPLELPFASGPIDWVRVQYPRATVFGLHWMVWFSVASCGGAILSALGAARK